MLSRAALVLTTAVIAAGLSSAFWLALRYGERSRQVAATGTVKPVPARPVLRLRPFGIAPRLPPPAAGPNPALSPAIGPAPPVTARIGEIPAELVAKKLTIPVPGVEASALVPDFYDARAERGHEALDIMAPRDQPVIAVEDGAIAKLFTSKLGGLTIYEFDPTQKYAYYYAHLDHYADGLIEGAKVTRGQVIGFVGSTGDADPAHPHLHFGIFLLGPEKQWWKGEALDPYPAFVTQPLAGAALASPLHPR